MKAGEGKGEMARKKKPKKPKNKDPEAARQVCVN